VSVLKARECPSEGYKFWSQHPYAHGLNSAPD